MAPKLQPKGAPKKSRVAEAQAAEASQQEAPKEAAKAAPVPNEAKPQAPKELAKQPAQAAAPKEAKPQAPKEAAKQPTEAAAPKDAKLQAPQEAAQQQAKQPAEATPTKKAKPQAPQEAPKHLAEAPGTKEAKPQAPGEAKKKVGQQPAEQWLQAGVPIPGWDDDSSSGGHPAEFSEGEIAELTDVEREAYKTAGPPPLDASDWSVPRKCGITPVGRSWQDREWRRQHSEEYCTAAVEAAGTVTKEGTPIHFTITTQRDRVTNENSPSVYYYIQGTMTTAWDSSEFIPIKEWLEEQESAREAAAEAEHAEKGHAADQPQVQEQQPEKGHAADQPSGEKATQGSGISTQKLWSTPGPQPRARREEPAMKKAPRSSVGHPLVRDSDTDSPVESEESDTITSRIRTHGPDPQQDTVRR